MRHLGIREDEPVGEVASPLAQTTLPWGAALPFLPCHCQEVDGVDEAVLVYVEVCVVGDLVCHHSGDLEQVGAIGVVVAGDIGNLYGVITVVAVGVFEEEICPPASELDTVGDAIALPCHGCEGPCQSKSRCCRAGRRRRCRPTGR